MHNFDLILPPIPCLHLCFSVENWVVTCQGTANQHWKMMYRSLAAFYRAVTPWSPLWLQWFCITALSILPYRLQHNALYFRQLKLWEILTASSSMPLDWIYRVNFFTELLSSPAAGCPGQWCSHHPWRHWKDTWMWHLGTCFSDGMVSAEPLDSRVCQVFSNFNNFVILSEVLELSRSTVLKAWGVWPKFSFLTHTEHSS